LTVISIIFGFVLATLTFYVSSVSAWSSEEKVRKVSNKLIDWHVWTIVCLIFDIIFTILLWLLDSKIPTGLPVMGYLINLRIASYCFLVFLNTYVFGQILNHVLTLWWVNQRKDTLEGKKT
jgi:hypothetical protein